MADLAVDPDYLEELAKILDGAAAQAKSANAETANIPHEVEKKWDPLFRAVNDKFVKAEHVRHEIEKIVFTCNYLAEKLRTAAHTYLNTDALTGHNLDKQVLDH